MAQRGKTRSLDMPEHVRWCAALVNKGYRDKPEVEN